MGSWALPKDLMPIVITTTTTTDTRLESCTSTVGPAALTVVGTFTIVMWKD